MNNRAIKTEYLDGLKKKIATNISRLEKGVNQVKDIKDPFNQDMNIQLNSDISGKMEGNPKLGCILSIENKHGNYERWNFYMTIEFKYSLSKDKWEYKSHYLGFDYEKDRDEVYNDIWKKAYNMPLKMFFKKKTIQECMEICAKMIEGVKDGNDISLLYKNEQNLYNQIVIEGDFK